MNPITAGSPSAKTGRPILTTRRWLVARVAGLIMSLCVLGWLARSIQAKKEFGWDATVLNFLHHSANPWLDRIAVPISRSGDIGVTVVLAVLCVVVLKRERRMRDAFFVTLAIAGVVTGNLLMRTAVQRIRLAPWETSAPTFDYGFPSSQTADTLAIVLIFAILTWSTRWRWFVIAPGAFYVFAIGLSRVYLGLHYPSDIVGGWALSFWWVTAASFVRGPASGVALRQPQKPDN